MPDPIPDPRAVIDAWDRILAARRPANMGHPALTARGFECLYTILAAERDLDELRAALGAWKEDRERLAAALKLCDRQGNAEMRYLLLDATAEERATP